MKAATASENDDAKSEPRGSDESAADVQATADGHWRHASGTQSRPFAGWFVLLLATLSGCGGPAHAGKSVDELRQMLFDGDAATRAAAAHGLGLYDEQAAPAVDDLAAALDDDEARVRIEAAVALGRIGPLAAPAVDPLCERLTDPEPIVRKQTATALGRIGDARALPPLRSALNDETPFVRAAASTAIDAIENR